MVGVCNKCDYIRIRREYHYLRVDLFLFSLMASILARRSFFLVVSGMTMSQPSSFWSFSLERSRSAFILVTLAMFLDSSLSSLESSSTGFRFFLRLTLRLFLSFFLGSMSSFLGMMLLLTMWWATLLLNLLPKLLRVLDSSCEVAFANFLYSSSFFFLVFSFSISFIFSSIILSAFSILLPFALFSLIQLEVNIFQGRLAQYLMRQLAAKMILKPRRNATRQVEARMMTLRGQSKVDNLIRMQLVTTLVEMYCRTNTNLRLYHSRYMPSPPSLSSPFVPHDRSSILQNAKSCSRFMQVGEQQMQDSTEVSIYTYFLKLKVHRMGRACPAITKTMSARSQMRGMMKSSCPSPRYI